MRPSAVFVLLLLAAGAAVALPLDDYVNLPDASYKWELANHVPNVGYDFYVLRLTSQTWLTTAETNWPVWERALSINFSFVCLIVRRLG